MFEGNREQDYRASTARTTSQLPGLWRPSFMCPRCKQPKPSAGRQLRVPGVKKLGYLCADCCAKKARP